MNPRSHPSRVSSLLASALFAVACTGTGGGGGVTPAPATSAPASPTAAAPGECPTSEPAPLPAGETRTVTIQTSQGSLAIKVDGSLSPIAAGNFVALAACGYYDGVVFHRLVPGFVIQGGDPTGTGTGGPGYTISDEPVTATYARGTVAMARTPQPDSQGSQFFIVLSDEARSPLERANTYAIFGTVAEGMDTVDKIAAMPNSGEPNNQALEPVAMDSVTVSTP